MKKGALYAVLIELFIVLVACTLPVGRISSAFIAAVLLVILILFSIFLLSFMNEPEEYRPLYRPLYWNMALIFSSVFAIIILFANLYRYTGLNGGQKNSIHDIFNCAYFSTITLTTVGYGDLTPTPGLGRLVAACEALAGYVTLGTLVAAIGFIAKPRSSSRGEREN